MMKQTSFRWLWLFIGLVLLVSAFAVAAGQPVSAEPNTPPHAPGWSAPTLISLPGQDSKVPQLAADPNSQRVLVAYALEWGDNQSNNDPYYNESLDNGATWTPFPAPIHSSDGVDSVQLDVAFDAQGTAHAVWIEGMNLVYAAESDWPGNIMHTISTAIGSPGAADPMLIASRNSTLDVIWSEATTGNPDIYHSRSADNGSTWSPKELVNPNSPATDEVPSIAVNVRNNNLLYAIWEQQAGIESKVYFSQGTANGSSVSWSAPIAISGTSGAERQPSLLVDLRGIQVTFMHEDANGLLVYYVRCQTNCTNVSSWNSPTNISGVFTDVNSADPFDIITVPIVYRGCLFTYYHGIDIDLTEQNELIWGVNQCDNWSGGGHERLTDPTVERTIYPDVTTQAGGWIYLVYDRVDSAHDEVYFMRSQNDSPYPWLYLPVIRRR